MTLKDEIQLIMSDYYVDHRKLSKVEIEMMLLKAYEKGMDRGKSIYADIKVNVLKGSGRQLKY